MYKNTSYINNAQFVGTSEIISFWFTHLLWVLQKRGGIHNKKFIAEKLVPIHIIISSFIVRKFSQKIEMQGFIFRVKEIYYRVNNFVDGNFVHFLIFNHEQWTYIL